MKKLSAKTDIRLNLLRCILVIVCFLCVIFFFTKPLETKTLAAFEIKESDQFNRNLKNYNIKLQILKSDESKDSNIIAQFATAIADDDEKRRIGLMHLSALPENHAMLFIFDKPQLISMWMKNTFIALDMLFIDDNDIIVSIASNTKPQSLTIISSQQPVVKVLEINAGLSKKLGIKIGSKVKIVHENNS